MKIFFGLLAALVALNGVLALPAKSPNDDAEVISVPRRRAYVDDDDDGTDFTNFKGVIDTGSGYPFLQPNPQTFAINFGFFDTFDDIFRRLSESFFPKVGDDSGSTEIGTRGGFDLDSKNANSTSTVKVVNGHKIEVNETVYGDDDSKFRVRIVNIRPLESGEEVEETVKTNFAGSKPSNVDPVTSAPTKDREDIEGDSEERREPLESDNEIRRNRNEQKASKSNVEGDSILLSPRAETRTTKAKTLSEDNRNANLNAAFVTDNSFVENEDSQGNGNIEAETNKPTENKMLENYDETTIPTTELPVQLDEQAQTNAVIDAEAEGTEDVISSVGSATVQDPSSTIENNEETETNDNFNESSEDSSDAATAAVEVTKELNEQVKDALSTLELNGEVVVPVTSAIETFSVEHFGNVEGASSSYDAEENAEAEHLSHDNLMREREDYASSSDDEGTEPIEMSPVFNSEWEHLAEELESVNDQNNDLNNDIDVYASVPVDLSNDIAVNEIAAAQPDFPINPDAEFIDVDGEINSSISMPKFEKLSMSTSFQPETMTMSPTK